MVWKLVEIDIRELFPPDELSVQMLRLMQCINDLQKLHMLIESCTASPPSNAATEFRVATLWFAQKMQAALMAEVLYRVLKDYKQDGRVIKGLFNLPEFQQLVKHMTPFTKRHLQRLRRYQVRPPRKLAKLLQRFRDKIAFHYDPDEFLASLNRAESNSTGPILKSPNDVSFVVADRLTLDILFEGSVRQQHGQQAMQSVGIIIARLEAFVIGLFHAYVRYRNLQLKYPDF